MAGYNSHMNDTFSPKKYSATEAVNDIFKYAGHSEDDSKGGDEMMYQPESLYGAKNDDSNPFKTDYNKKDEETDEFGRLKDKGFKPTGVEEKIEESLGEKYKPQNNDEIAHVLFGTKSEHISSGPDISDLTAPQHEDAHFSEESEEKEESHSEHEDSTTHKKTHASKDSKDNKTKLETKTLETHTAKSKNINNANSKTVEDILGKLPWQKKK